MKKSFILGIIVGLIITSTSLVLAGTTIQAMLNDKIQVVLNGKIQEFRDETTNEIQYPITYNNRTYLPLRTISNLLDVNVDYDEEKKAAILTSITNDITIEFEKETYTFCNSSGEKITNKREIPFVKYLNEDIAKKMTERLQEINNKYWDNANVSAEEFINNIYGNKGLGLQICYSNFEKIGNYVMIQLYQSGGFGGVSWDESYYAVFDINTGEQVHLKDLIKNEKEFADVVVNICKPEDCSEFIGDWESEFRRLIFEDGNWTITNNGIKFVLPKYSIGIGALGMPTFEVSNEAINEYLNIN